MIIALVISFLFAMACLCYDAHWTDKGIRAGIAIEGNGMIKFIAGTDKPAFWELVLIDGGVIRVPIFLLGLFLPFGGPGTIPFIVMLAVCGLKNIQGGRQWIWMFNHPGQKLPVMDSAWKQFIGFWG